MSVVISYAVGNGDMFAIQHGSDNFTIIDCSMSEDDREWILEDLNKRRKGKDEQRTHRTRSFKMIFLLASSLTTSSAWLLAVSVHWS